MGDKQRITTNKKYALSLVPVICFVAGRHMRNNATLEKLYTISRTWKERPRWVDETDEDHSSLIQTQPC